MRKQFKSIPLIHPTTIVLVGTRNGEKANFTTIGDVAVAGINPSLVMISLNANHNATKYVLEHKKMSINMTVSDLLKHVDFAGMYSSKNVDKSTLVEYEVVDDLPIIKQSPISLIVETLDYIQIEHRLIFVCNVTKTLIEEDLIQDNRINLSGIKPILYGLDNFYYTGLEIIGTGYKEGIKLKNLESK